MLNNRMDASLELALAGSIHPTSEGGSASASCKTWQTASTALSTRMSAETIWLVCTWASAFLIHAAGMGVDELEFPEQLEHFGITPVEAASFGCIPVVFAGGGPEGSRCRTRL